MIYVKTRSPAEAKTLLTFISKDLASPLTFNTVKTPDQYAKTYGKTHNVICYDFETKHMTGHRASMHDLIHPADKPITVNQFLKAAPKLKAALHQPFVKTAPAFLMGFEIEGCVHPDYRLDLIAYMRDLYPNVGDARLIHHDGSIRPKCRGIEIVTPPLPIDDAIERLEWLLGLLAVLSSEDAFHTNHTTGLHVNISEGTTFGAANREARARWTYEFMKRVDPDKWRARFRRTNNKYCEWYGHPTTHQEVGQYARHWSAINTEHLNDAVAANRRVEVRCAGGKDYHAREDVSEFLLDIRNAAQQAYDAI